MQTPPWLNSEPVNVHQPGLKSLIGPVTYICLKMLKQAPEGKKEKNLPNSKLEFEFGR